MIITTLLTIISVSALSACGTHNRIQNPQPATADTSGKPALPDGRGGVYKTGNPYKIGNRWYTPMKQVSHYDESGVASWYGDDFHGKLTANGETYDMHTLSAAHKTLPLPTLVRVTNLENGRTVIVRVNDRGPFVKNRLIDLSYASAKELGFVEQGTTRVRVQTLDEKPVTTAAVTAKPDSPPPLLLENRPEAPVVSNAGKGNIYIQLGAFGSKANAERLQRELLSSYPAAALHPKTVADRTFYRVRIGPFEHMSLIEKTMISLQQRGYREAAVVID